MHEIYGWVLLSESTRDIDEGGLKRKVQKIQDQCNKAEWELWAPGKLEVILNNGTYKLTVHAISDREGSESKDFHAILNNVVAELPGSYGVIYETVQQDHDGYGAGSYKVFVVRRGRIEVHQDPFLSPRNKFI